MTAITTGLAFVPAIILGDVPGLEIMRPVAIIMAGGLVTSTLLTLFILPALYLSLKVRPARELELYPVNPSASVLINSVADASQPELHS